LLRNSIFGAETSPAFVNRFGELEVSRRFFDLAIDLRDIDQRQGFTLLGGIAEIFEPLFDVACDARMNLCFIDAA